MQRKHMGDVLTINSRVRRNWLKKKPEHKESSLKKINLKNKNKRLLPGEKAKMRREETGRSLRERGRVTKEKTMGWKY
jgi:hypothetical protein